MLTERYCPSMAVLAWGTDFGFLMSFFRVATHRPLWIN